jgi:hypothetical protein
MGGGGSSTSVKPWKELRPYITETYEGAQALFPRPRGSFAVRPWGSSAWAAPR